MNNNRHRGKVWQTFALNFSTKHFMSERLSKSKKKGFLCFPATQKSVNQTSAVPRIISPLFGVGYPDETFFSMFDNLLLNNCVFRYCQSLLRSQANKTDRNPPITNYELLNPLAVNFCFLKAGFHQRRSRSRSRKRSRKSAYDLVKIKNRSRKRSHKRDLIGVRRIRTFPFSSDFAYDSVAYVPLMIQ